MPFLWRTGYQYRDPADKKQSELAKSYRTEVHWILGVERPGELLMKLKTVLLGVALSSSSGFAMALTTLPGTHFTVTFDSSLQGLFGDPVLLVGDVLRWRPTNLVDRNVGLISSTANVTVTANAGYDLSAFTFAEAGQYMAWRRNTGTFNVNASGTLHVGPTSTSSVATGILAAPGNVSTLQSWGVLAGAAVPVPLNTHSVTVKVDQILFASKTGLAGAYVNLVTADVGITTHAAAPVPEPETYAMMLAGLGALGFLSRRRRQD